MVAYDKLVGTKTLLPKENENTSMEVGRKPKQTKPPALTATVSKPSNQLIVIKIPL